MAADHDIHAASFGSLPFSYFISFGVTPTIRRRFIRSTALSLMAGARPTLRRPRVASSPPRHADGRPTARRRYDAGLDITLRFGDIFRYHFEEMIIDCRRPIFDAPLLILRFTVSRHQVVDVSRLASLEASLSTAGHKEARDASSVSISFPCRSVSRGLLHLLHFSVSSIMPPGATSAAEPRTMPLTSESLDFR